MFTLINPMLKFLGPFDFAAFASFCLKLRLLVLSGLVVRDGIEQQTVSPQFMGGCAAGVPGWQKLVGTRFVVAIALCGC